MNILVDGYNIALPKGTGVATYARNFINVARGMKHRVDLLFGDAPFAAPGFEGPQARARRKSHPFPVERTKRMIGSLRSAIYNPVRQIDSDCGNLTHRDRVPAVERMWSSPDLFRNSVGAYRRIGTVATVNVPGIDLAHWTYPLPIRAKGALNIYTIHDMVPMRLPNATLDDKGKFLSLCSRICQSADHILTVSECSRRDIIDLTGIHGDKVTNTYQSFEIDEEYQRTDIAVSKALVRDLFNLDYKGFFLFFGAIEPKKNVARLIEAYLSVGTDTPLVIVGAPGWSAERELALLDQHAHGPAAGNIIHLEYLPRAILVHLIRCARATTFPALYEGFGLPALESMALGTAVIASRTGSLPEVVGDAALLVDPYDVRSIRDAIQAIDNRPDLRRSLEKNGIEQAQLFNHAAYARRLRSLFSELLPELPHP